jgi:hypothetical protein
MDKQVMYFVIEYESVRMLTREQLLKEIKQDLEDYEGDLPYKYLDNVTDTDPAYWGENTRLIIKGEIVVPSPRQVATQYEID